MPLARLSIAGLAVLAIVPHLGADAEPHVAGLAVPVAMAWDREGLLHVALRDARRVVVVDVPGRSPRRTYDLPFRPASITPLDGEAMIVGGQDGECAILDTRGKPIREFTPGRGPTRAIPLTGGRIALASLWDRSVRVAMLKSEQELTYAIPFEPGLLLEGPGGRLIVLDAFRSSIASFKPGDPSPARVHELDGVNLHAAALSADGSELLVAHMRQYGTLPITGTNIDWGLVFSSKLSLVRVADLDLEPSPGRPLERLQVALDGSGNGAADPTAVALSPDGATVVIASGGSHSLLVVRRPEGPENQTARGRGLGSSQAVRRVAVGANPRATVVDADGKFAIVANAMDDTLTVIELGSMRPEATISLLDSSPQRSEINRGEAAFHDGRLAMDRWMTCASCHPSGHTNSLNFDTQGDRSIADPKNTPSLLGLRETAPYTWTGEFERLADQIHQSYQTSLRGRRATLEDSAAVATYLESLPPAPPLLQVDSPARAQGEALFRELDCARCHAGPALTGKGLHDVGLDDGAGFHRRFNPPSLRGVGRTGPYLHDGRAGTLSEVFRIHPPEHAGTLDDDERAALADYLKSL